MITGIVLIFILGYVCIALEHKIKIDKAAFALLMCGIIWTVLSIFSGDADIEGELVSYLGDTCETLIFLIGAMTIVDLIDMHGGFSIITDHITTREKRRLMWLLAFITFFMSAVLDNMTTTIIMVMVLRRLISDRHERWIFTGVIVIAANSGGAWSPIGDVTTIMLWMRGNVTAGALSGYLLLPCLVSLIIPTAFASRMVKGHVTHVADAVAADALPEGVGPRFSRSVLIGGILGLLFVPVFKSLTGLPPYMGMMISLSVLWVCTEIVYDRKRGIEESIKNRVAKVVKHIDMPTILFFLGILMAVSGLQYAGVLSDAAHFLDTHVHEAFSIATAVGILSSVVDNVPLVAACMGMYPVADPAAIAAAADPSYMAAFAAAVTCAHDGYSAVFQHHAHVVEVEVYLAVHGDDVRDAFGGHQHDVVGAVVGVFKAHVAVYLAQFVVLHDDEGVHVAADGFHSVQRLVYLLDAFPLVGYGDDAHGEYVHFLGRLGYDGGGACAGASAHACGDEHHARAVAEMVSDVVHAGFCLAAAFIGVVAGAEAFAQQQLVGHGRVVEGLRVGVAHHEGHAVDAFVVHVVHGVASAAAYADYFDDFR